MDLLDVVVEVSGGVAWVVTERAYEWFLSAVDCYMILECFCFVGFIITMSTIELEYSSMSVFTVQHLVKSHVTISTLITPGKKIFIMNYL